MGVEPARLVVLISGGGRSLVNLHAACARGELPARVVRVIAGRDCPGVERARGLGLPCEVVTGEIPADRLGAMLEAEGAGWVVLAGYLRLVRIPRGFEGRVVNIHPALLPAFGGTGMHGMHVHRAVLASGARVSGCTVHLCDERYDRGPIVLQRRCAVMEGDTPETLAARVFEQECLAYPEALRRLVTGSWRVGDEPVVIDA